MSDDIWNTEDETDLSAPKALREYAEKLKKELEESRKAAAELQKEYAKLEKSQKVANLEGILRDKQVPANIAKWIKRDDVDASEEAVSKWLEENGEDFGYKANQPPTQQAQPDQSATPVVSEADAQALEAWGSLDENRPGGGIDVRFADQLKDMEARNLSYDEIVEGLRKAGVPVGSGT